MNSSLRVRAITTPFNRALLKAPFRFTRCPAFLIQPQHSHSTFASSGDLASQMRLYGLSSYAFGTSKEPTMILSKFKPLGPIQSDISNLVILAHLFRTRSNFILGGRSTFRPAITTSTGKATMKEDPKYNPHHESMTKKYDDIVKHMEKAKKDRDEFTKKQLRSSLDGSTIAFGLMIWYLISRYKSKSREEEEAKRFIDAHRILIRDEELRKIKCPAVDAGAAMSEACYSTTDYQGLGWFCRIPLLLWSLASRHTSLLMDCVWNCLFIILLHIDGSWYV